MSEAFHIISDGSCDLPLELTKEKNITVVPFYVSFEEGKYQKEMVEIGVREFYQKMVDHPDVYPKSSMPSVQDYLDAFLPYVKAGTPIICICITTKFSGSMQSALNAKAILEEEYPESQIYVCDSCVNTVLQGIYVLEAVRLRDAGAGYQESIDRLNEIKSSGRIFFTVGNMEYLKHGGRIGKVASVAGSLLGIKPIITLKEGEIFPSGIGRSRRKTVDKTIDLLLAYLAEDYLDAFLPYVKAGTPIICICITTKFSGSMQSALNAKAILEEEYPESQIYVCDSCVNTVLQGIYVLEAVRLRDAGAGYQESIDRLNEIKSSGRIFFTVGNMEYLKHGGRIGKVASVAGSLLGIKPIITLKEGEIFPSGIGRSRRKTVDKTIDLLLAYLAEEKTDIADYSICIGYGYDKEEAVEFRDRLVSRLKEKEYDIDTIPIFQIGATIGVHTGPYPLGIGVVKKSIRE